MTSLSAKIDPKAIHYHSNGSGNLNVT